jgi:hypothetical protein
MTRVALLTAALAALAIPSSAQAIGVSGTAAPTDPTAGAHSDFVIHMDFTGGQVKDLTVGLPPGMVGDPTATPKCSVAQLGADACPANTVVGEVSAMATVGVLPVPATGFLYNLEPHAGEPARFGIVLHPLGLPGVVPPIILQSGAQLRSSDFGLNTIINDIPNSTLAAGDTTITSQDITLYGIAPGTGKPFMRNPTSCNPKTTSFSANSYADPNTTATGEAPAFTPTNCGALPFSPTFSARIGAPGLNNVLGKPPVSSVIEQDDGEAGLREARVLLPPDLGVDLVRLNESCSIPDFQAAACPPGLFIGSAIATSPLLTQPLTGPVVLVQGLSLPNLGLNLGGPLTLNLQGILGLEGAVTFGGLPDIPISHFELNFFGGPAGLNVADRNLCLPPAPRFHEDFTGHNGASTSLDTSATVEGGCGPALGKCKAKKGKKKAKKHSASAAKKKHKKKSCKKKKKKRKKR